jgi:hypothetical protein
MLGPSTGRHRQRHRWCKRPPCGAPPGISTCGRWTLLSFGLSSKAMVASQFHVIAIDCARAALCRRFLGRWFRSSSVYRHHRPI